MAAVVFTGEVLPNCPHRDTNQRARIKGTTKEGGTASAQDTGHDIDSLRARIPEWSSIVYCYSVSSPPPNLFLRVTQAGSGFLLLLFVFSTETKATSSMKHACALPKENAVVHR